MDTADNGFKGDTARLEPSPESSLSAAEVVSLQLAVTMKSATVCQALRSCVSLLPT